MDKILEHYTKKQIREICGVPPKTVYNWFKNGTMPFRMMKKLGFGLFKLPN
jgi:predicted site-specific integrase-resolvase